LEIRHAGSADRFDFRCRLAREQGIVHGPVTQQPKVGVRIPGLGIKTPQLARDFKSRAQRLEDVAIGKRDGDTLAVRVQQGPFHRNAADGVGPVEHNETNSVLGSGLHSQAHRRDVCVEPRADVLKVIQSP
jgi:hypothetical protein